MNDYWFAPIMLEQINRAIKNYEASKRIIEHLRSFSFHVRDLRKKEGLKPEIPLIQEFLDDTNEIEIADSDNIYTTIDKLLDMKWKIMQLIESSNTQTKIEKKMTFQIVTPDQKETK